MNFNIVEIHPTDSIPVPSSPGYLTLVIPRPKIGIDVNQVVLADGVLYRVIHPPDVGGGHLVLTVAPYPVDRLHLALLDMLKEARK